MTQNSELRNCHQISLLILSENKSINLSLFPLKSSENRMFSDDFRMISGGIVVNWFAQIRLILEARVGDDY